MKKDQRYTNAYIFGAVCPQHDKGAAIVMPYANTDAMNKHLAEISKHIAQGAHAVVIIDRAGWHTAENTVVPDNISLMPLPPYSPELNSQENVWDYLRQNYLAGEVFDTYDNIVDVCCRAWNSLINEEGRIASIAFRSWIAQVTS